MTTLLIAGPSRGVAKRVTLMRWTPCTEKVGGAKKGETADWANGGSLSFNYEYLTYPEAFFFGFPPVPFVRFYAHRFCPEHFIFSLIISFAIFLSNYEYTYLYFSYSLFLTRSLFLFSLYCVHSAKTIPHSFQVVLHPLNVHGENTTWLNPCLAWPSLTC